MNQDPSQRRGVLILVAAVTVFAVATIVAAVVIMGSDRGGPVAAPPTSTERPQSQTTSAPEFSVNHCVQGLGQRDVPVRGRCDDGGSPYRIVRISTRGCPADQAAFTRGEWNFCLTPNLNKNFCYRIPDAGYIETSRCQEPGSVVVVDRLPGLYTGPGERPSCTTRLHWDTYFSWQEPPLTVCVHRF